MGRLPIALSVVVLLSVGCESASPSRTGVAGSATPSAAASPSARPQPNEVGRGSEWPTDTFVVWTRSGLSPSEIAEIGSVDGVEASATVTGGLLWAIRDGDRALPYPVPIDAAFVDRRDFRAVAPPPIEEPVVAGWRGGLAVLSETGARLRGPERVIATETYRYAFAQESVADEAALGFEVLIAERPRPGWGRSFMIVRFDGSQQRLTEAVGRIVEAPVRVHRSGQERFLRHADAVEPLMLFKERFGEFGAQPVGGRLRIDPRWLERNIVTARVPLLGEVVCHRETVDMLRVAMDRLRSSGRSSLIDPSGFAGCFDPRFIGSDPSAPLSAHAFGAAVDINSSDNPQGGRGDMHEEVIEAMHEAGFTWGGRWLLPDPMHFEWYSFER